MKKNFLSALTITLLTMLLFGVLYPLFIIGLAKLIAPGNGSGEIIKVNGKVVGFAVIGQSFTDAKYFNSRPSAVNYNPAATGGSNKGVNNPDYLKQVSERISIFLLQNPAVSKREIPVDLITASGGGLDPHISIAAADIQIPRIAMMREINEEVVKMLVDKYSEYPLAGVIGVSRINVLKINIALDQLDQR